MFYLGMKFGKAEQHGGSSGAYVVAKYLIKKDTVDLNTSLSRERVK
jgi:hypothetical protein